jgi:hypothetical protein
MEALTSRELPWQKIWRFFDVVYESATYGAVTATAMNDGGMYTLGTRYFIEGPAMFADSDSDDNQALE